MAFNIHFQLIKTFPPKKHNPSNNKQFLIGYTKAL